MQRTLSLGTLAACLTASLAMAQSVVIPNGTNGVEGNSSTSYPWNRTSSAIKLQQVYDSSHFTTQGITFPILINNLKFRANGSATTYTGGTYSGVTIQLSTAAVDHASMSTTFANNYGPDVTTVFTGSVTQQPTAGTTPNNWYVDVAITPFLYDPSLGDLLLEVHFPSGSWVGGTSSSCDFQSTNSMVYRLYNLTDNLAATGSGPYLGGLVMDVGYNPASGVYAGFTATPTVGASPLAVQFTDTSFSAPNPITSWAWDFQNDGTIDSTLQNPIFTYGCGVYDVSLTVSDGTTTDTKVETAFITVDPLTADFSASPTAGYLPLVVNFTDQSTGASAWAWDFDNDGTVDSTLQNPTWAYGAVGQYTVALTVFNACNTATETKVNYITVGAPGVRPAQPDLLQLQFNEVRGDNVANTATGSTIAANLPVNNATWQGDAARAGFMGNEAGLGCMENAGAVDTGWGVDITGSFSIGFWIRLDAGVTTAPTATGYVFSNSTFRAFNGGVAYESILFRGTTLGDFDANFDIGLAANMQWHQFTLVVDDAVGMATWYVDGQVTNTLAFTPNTFSYVSTSTLKVGASSATGSSAVGANFAIDDFRMYTRALAGFEALALFLESEHATAGAAGSSCPTVAGEIGIAGTGGVPTKGNLSFAVEASNLEAGQLAAIVLDFSPASALVFNLDPWLGGPGCELQLNNFGALIGIPSATNTLTLPLGLPAWMPGLHIYAQAAQFGSAGGGMSKLLDINIKD